MMSTNSRRFQVTYMIFTDPDKQFGHASIGIAELKEDGHKELIFRVGLFPSNQVELEDFIKPKPGRVFREKSIDITPEQLISILHVINSDRDLETSVGSKEQMPENKSEAKDALISIPSGPKYDKLNFNCKDYALSVMERAGIEAKEFENLGISLPVLSGNLQKVIMEHQIDENGNETNVMILKPIEQKLFIDKLIKWLMNLLSKGSGLHHEIFKHNDAAAHPTLPPKGPAPK